MPGEFPDALNQMQEKIAKENGLQINFTNSTEGEDDTNIKQYLDKDQTSMSKEFEEKTEKDEMPR